MPLNGFQSATDAGQKSPTEEGRLAILFFFHSFFFDLSLSSLSGGKN